MAIRNLANKARDTLRGRKPQIDQGLDKAQQAVSDRTGGKYDEKMSSVRQQADKVLGEEESGSKAGDQRDDEFGDRRGDDDGSSQQR